MQSLAQGQIVISVFLFSLKKALYYNLTSVVENKYTLYLWVLLPAQQICWAVGHNPL